MFESILRKMCPFSLEKTTMVFSCLIGSDLHNYIHSILCFKLNVMMGSSSLTHMQNTRRTENQIKFTEQNGKVGERVWSMGGHTGSSAH